MNYLIQDTIAAPVTPKGKSAIAIIRLSGKDAFQITNKIFKTSNKNAGQIKYGYIVDGSKNIDEVLCYFFKSPRSYTGEDTVEISTHGTPVITNEVLSILYKNGARAANPGEFTYRAFINSKKDLISAEAVCTLIESKTSDCARAALNNIAGKFSQKIKKLKNDLVDLIAFMEVNLDHPEEDIMFLSRQEKLSKISDLTSEIQKLIDVYKTSKILQDGIKIAIVGKPNAGKSSLLNAILGKNRAIVTEIAGTTTDSIEETINCNGIPVTIIDTAGIRNHSENSIENLGQQKSKEAIEKSDILIWLFDSCSKISDDDAKISELLKTLPDKIYIIGVLNKIDLVPQISEDEVKSLAKFANILKISAKTEQGVDHLLNILAEIAGASQLQEDTLIINSRHQKLLQTTFEALLKTQETLSQKDADEIACFEANRAKDALNEILGIEIKEDILDSIFSNFCIGK
ncbi:MAG: tRNA uridine-5-carboxymethylaminomethyl(34) synthesis GTPase MnmE [Elusimicrobiota bacterium]|jgi:tRNA modification GTPase|nr:tRNA uridine-5-carboxymethylaminomethyl(34) synthesis GTPase MnmE [Elusimicrobiota bacterium]